MNMDTNVKIFLVFLVLAFSISAVLVKLKKVKTANNTDKKNLYFILMLGVFLPILAIFIAKG